MLGTDLDILLYCTEKVHYKFISFLIILFLAYDFLRDLVYRKCTPKWYSQQRPVSDRQN